MRTIDRIYIDGELVAPEGQDVADLFNPATEEKIGQVQLGERADARTAVAAAKRAFPTMALASKADRIAIP